MWVLKKRRFGRAAIVSLLLLLLFQNCGPGFKTLQEANPDVAITQSVSTTTTTTVRSSTTSTFPTTTTTMVRGPSSTPTSTTTTTFPTSTTTSSTTTTTTLPKAVVLTENPYSTAMAADSVMGIHANEIFQEKDNGQATIQISLNTSVASGFTYYSIALLNSSNATERVLASGPRNQKTTFNFDLSTGMTQRKIRFSLHDGQGLEQQRWISPSFAVGEVFIVAGQSNSSNHGEAPTTSVNSINRGVDPATKAWVPMVDPLPYGSTWAVPPWGTSATTNPGGSPWPSFSDDLSSQLHVPVGVMSIGWGGSAASWWLANATIPQGSVLTTNLFTRLVQAAQTVPSCGFRAVLWHQGESDSMGQFSAASYIATMQSVISSFRAATGCQQPWMMARVSYLHSKYWVQNYGGTVDAAEAMKWKAEVEIRKAQNQLAQSAGFALGPDTDLVISHSYRFDDLHFSSSGLGIHGKLWSQRVLAMLGHAAQFEQDLVPEVRTIWNSYQNVLMRSPTEIAADPEGVRYWVDKLSLGKLTITQIEDNFRASDEFFIRSVYRDNFGRQPTPDELTGWLAKLSSGVITSRTELKAEILKTK